MTNNAHNCRWVINPFAPGIAAVYCEKPVTYIMARDDDDNVYRKYGFFCQFHKGLADVEELTYD